MFVAEIFMLNRHDATLHDEIGDSDELHIETLIIDNIDHFSLFCRIFGCLLKFQI